MAFYTYDVFTLLLFDTERDEISSAIKILDGPAL